MSDAAQGEVLPVAPPLEIATRLRFCTWTPVANNMGFWTNGVVALPWPKAVALCMEKPRHGLFTTEFWVSAGALAVTAYTMEPQKFDALLSYLPAAWAEPLKNILGIAIPALALWYSSRREAAKLPLASPQQNGVIHP